MTDLHRLMSELADRMPADSTPVENAVAAAHRIRRRRAALAAVLTSLAVVGFVLLTYFATVNRAEPEPTQPKPSTIPSTRIEPHGNVNPLLDRQTPSPDAGQEAETLLPTVRAALDQARARGRTTASELRQAVVEAGVPAERAGLKQENGQVAVGISVGSNACLYGYVYPDRVDVEAGGGSLDGGCMPFEKGR